MQIDVGKFYFIKDEFFEIVNDRELMKNKENSIKRPCYYCFKSKENEKIIWFIPVSTKIEKYKKIYQEIAQLDPEDTLQLILEADTEEQREFYQVVGDFLLQKKQKEVIERNLF